MLLLVGLGNPGPKYANHRHNIGFVTVDAIARRYGFGPWRARFSGEVAAGEIGGVKVLAFKPMTFMNDSGRSIAEAIRFYKLETSDVVVVHDELDLAPGKVRVKASGGHGGHNGLRDVIPAIGDDFRRVRIGIGHPGDKALVHNHVLRDFAKAERPLFEKVVEAVVDAAPLLVAGNDNRFMSKVALIVNPPPEKPEKPEKPEQPDEPGPEPASDGD